MTSNECITASNGARLHWREIVARALPAFHAVEWITIGDDVDVPAHPEVHGAHITDVQIDYGHQPDPVLVEYASDEDGHHCSRRVLRRPRRPGEPRPPAPERGGMNLANLQLLAMADDAIAYREEKAREAREVLEDRKSGDFWCKECAKADVLCAAHEEIFRKAAAHDRKADEYREIRLVIVAALIPAAARAVPA